MKAENSNISTNGVKNVKDQKKGEKQFKYPEIGDCGFGDSNDFFLIELHAET